MTHTRPARDAALAALGYETTTHPDVVSRPLDRSRETDRGFRDGFLYCSCRTIASGVIRHVPTGYRELWCGNDWHGDLRAFVDRAVADSAYFAGLRTADDAFIAANPDTEEAQRLAEQWAAMDPYAGTPE